MTVAIQVENVGKSFALGKREPISVLKRTLFGRGAEFEDSFWALRNINFEIQRGESWGIIGRNGSGKSTLLQIICGIQHATEGRVEVAGKAAALLELGAGFDLEYTGRQNVYMNGALLGLTEHEVDARYDDILAFADIGRFINEPVRTYSSGMFVRLAFAVAAHAYSDIIIIDEALAVGDARFTAKCLKRLARMKDDGATLLFVSHDVSTVRRLCEKAIWLNEGKTRAIGESSFVTSRYMEFLFSDEAEELPAPASVSSDLGASTESVDIGPINHWGSCVGSILSVEMRGSSEAGRNVFLYGEDISLRVRIKIPEHFSREHLSLAFSLKDLKGTDIFVTTTHEENPEMFASCHGEIEIEFRFRNQLTPGKFVLVVALEDRSAPVPQYLEYIEGARYFAVLSDKPRFGLFNAPVEVLLQV